MRTRTETLQQYLHGEKPADIKAFAEDFESRYNWKKRPNEEKAVWRSLYTTANVKRALKDVQRTLNELDTPRIKDLVSRVGEKSGLAAEEVIKRLADCVYHRQDGEVNELAEKFDCPELFEMVENYVPVASELQDTNMSVIKTATHMARMKPDLAAKIFSVPARYTGFEPKQVSNLMYVLQHLCKRVSERATEKPADVLFEEYLDAALGCEKTTEEVEKVLTPIVRENLEYDGLYGLGANSPGCVVYTEPEDEREKREALADAGCSYKPVKRLADFSVDLSYGESN